MSSCAASSVTSGQTFTLGHAQGDSVETVASVVQRNLRIGDACTFRLIAKNVTSLLPPSKRELSKETNAQLEELIRSALAAARACVCPWQAGADTACLMQLVRHARSGPGKSLGR